ncbi:MAG: hypothetical protein WBC21_02910 [Minisyncoccales bacterium]
MGKEMERIKEAREKAKKTGVPQTFDIGEVLVVVDIDGEVHGYTEGGIVEGEDAVLSFSGKK